MRKRIISLVLTAIMLMSMLPVSAFAETLEQDNYKGTFGEFGDNLIWELDTTSGELKISGTGRMSYISYSDYFNAPWYSYHSFIKTVTISEGVTNICNNAFYGCTLLSSITIPDSVNSIGNRAFVLCESLKQIVIPDNVSLIYAETFQFCKSLTNVTIGNSVKSIGTSAFAGCTSLKTLIMPIRIKNIYAYAFQSCTMLTDVYYQGSQEDWDSIDISNKYNDCLTNATIHYFYNEDQITIPDDPTPFDLKTDGYSFANAEEGFGYGSFYKIPLSIYKDVFGWKYTSQRYKSASFWGGNCYGISTTSILFHESILNASDYAKDGVYSNVNNSLYSKNNNYFGVHYYSSNKNSELTKMIERYQVWQDSKQEFEYRKSNRIFYKDSPSNSDSFLQLLNKFDNYHVQVFWNGGGHSLVIDSSRKPEYLGNEWYRVFLYDPNNPYYPNFENRTERIKNYYANSTARYIDVNTESNQWKINVGATASDTGKRVGYTDSGNYIDGSILFIWDATKSPTGFYGNYSFEDDNGIVLYNLGLGNNMVIFNKDGDIVLKIFDNEVYTVPVISRIFKSFDQDDNPIYDFVLPFDNYTIELEDGNSLQIQNGDSFNGIIADADTTIVLNIDGTVKVSGEESTTVDLVVENANQDTDEFTSVNMLIENDGENNTTVLLDKDNHLDVISTDENISVNVIANGFENELALNDVALSDIENEDIVEYALGNGELIPNNIEHATIETYSGIYDGKEHYGITYIDYLGMEMTEGVDYVPSGDISATDIGTYTITVTGIGTYRGTVDVTYSILPALNAPELSIDVDDMITVTATFEVVPECDNYSAVLNYGENSVSNEEYIVDGDKLIFTFDDIPLSEYDSGFSAVIYAAYDNVMVSSEFSKIRVFNNAGTVEDPYLINSENDLIILRKIVNSGKNCSGKFFKQTSDIILNDIANISEWVDNPPENEWIPIGDSSNVFCGTYDGDYHIIEGLYIDSTESYQGLFGQVGSGTIKNLGIESGYIYSTGNGIGGICGAAGDSGAETIFNCFNNAAVYSDTGYCGGIIGFSGGTIITDCYNTGNIYGRNQLQSFAGGIIGGSSSMDMIQNVFNTGNISGFSYVGGIIGGSQNTCSLNNSFNIGNISGMINCGSLIGNAATISASNCYYLTGTTPFGSTNGTLNATALDMDSLKAESVLFNDIKFSRTTWNFDESAGHLIITKFSKECVHVWNDGIVTVEPTCTETGSKTITCLVCGTVKTDSIPALGHIYTSKVVAPTCTENGYNEHKCSRCGDTYITDEVPAKGHVFDEWDIVVYPTCMKTGQKESVCEFCDEEISEIIPAKGHDFGEWQDHPDDGTLEIRYCSRCDVAETREKEIVIVDGINIVKVSGYNIKLVNLDPTLSYTIRYATGEYATASAIKKGLNAGFVQVSGVTEATITLPTHGLHTISAQVGSEVVFIGTVTIDESDMKKEVEVYVDDLNLRVLNLYGATRVNLIKNGNIIKKINPTSFTTDGLKTWADIELPEAGNYTIRVLFGSEYIEAAFDATVPAATISTNGRIFTLNGYGTGNVSFMRLAKGVITTTAEMKAASDLRTYGRKHFTGDTAAFAALDAVNGETTTYTVQIGYASGYTEFVTFDITPTVPVITTTADSITLSNIQTDLYYLDWVRCAPGVQTSLYGVRHAKGSQIKKTADIVNGTIAFTGLSAGTYTLYYLYDGWNLSEGMVTVTVG